MLKISFGRSEQYKNMHSFFFREFQLITVLLSICDFYMSWSTRLVYLKLCVGFSNLCLCSTKCMGTLTLKRYNSFQNYNHRKTIHSLAPRSLIFKLQQELLKLNDICVSWSSPKTDLQTNLLNLEIEVLRMLVFLDSNF